MDLSIYTQRNCVNGISKEEVGQIKENVAKIAEISNDVQEVQDRVQDMEYFSGNWKLFELRDWTSLVDENNKLKRDVLISIFATGRFRTGPEVITPVRFMMMKGTDFTFIPDIPIFASESKIASSPYMRVWQTTYMPSGHTLFQPIVPVIFFTLIHTRPSAGSDEWTISYKNQLDSAYAFDKYIGQELNENGIYIALYIRPNFNENDTN